MKRILEATLLNSPLRHDEDYIDRRIASAHPGRLGNHRGGAG